MRGDSLNPVSVGPGRRSFNWTMVSWKPRRVMHSDTFVQWCIAIVIPPAGSEFVITLDVNGKLRRLEVPGDMPLLWILQDCSPLRGHSLIVSKALNFQWWSLHAP